MNKVSLLIIGGGAAGMATAIAAAKAGVEDILLVERGQRLGGILPQCLHNGFGLSYFQEDLTGQQYAKRFVDKLKNYPVKTQLNTMVLELRKDKTALLSSGDGLQRISFDHAVLATGCRERPLGALPIYGTRPAGIFTAGQAQKMVNLSHYDIGDDIIILGSGDIGLIMARQFKLLGKNVLAVIEQNQTLGGLPSNQENCIKAFDIPVILSATIARIHGKERICGVTLRHLGSGKYEYLACSTLVISVGLIPEQELAEPLLTNDGWPQWLSLCGNCDYVHKIVDTVTMQGERIGAGNLICKKKLDNVY